MAQQHKATGGQHAHSGAPNVEFDLVSEMHSLLKGTSALEQYIEDARAAGDQEVETCFRAIHDQSRDNAIKLRSILAQRIAKAA